MRRKFDEEFMVKGVLEALQEEKTLQEPADEYEVHPNRISAWKSRLWDIIESCGLGRTRVGPRVRNRETRGLAR